MRRKNKARAKVVLIFLSVTSYEVRQREKVKRDTEKEPAAAKAQK
jgi:hypothetical protein